MVLFNYSTRELTAKIVYYGPGLCGKTTNLQFIFESLPDDKKGRMLSLSTQTDRTLYFDFLPMDLGEIRGMKTRIQLYTVPGQVFYNETRKMVLKGVDGVVFVADSQTQMADANLESFRNLMENLEEHGVDPATIPIVLQFNKRDLPSIMSVEEMNATLNRYNAPFYEAIATTGIGVHDTLKAVSKLVLRSLSGRYEQGEEHLEALSDTDMPAPVVDTPAPEAAPVVATDPTVEAPAPPAPPAAVAESPATDAWDGDNLESQLDRMDAAEIEGLLQEVEGFDLDTVDESTVADLSGANGADAETDFGMGELDLGAPEDRFEPGAGGTDEDLFDAPAADVPAAQEHGVSASQAEPAGAELSFESFMAEQGDPATGAAPIGVVELTGGGTIRVPITLEIDGKQVRYSLILRLQPEPTCPAV